MFKFGIGFLCFVIGFSFLLLIIFGLYAFFLDLIRKKRDGESEEFKRCTSCSKCVYCDKNTMIVNCSVYEKEHLCPSHCNKYAREEYDILKDLEDFKE